MLQFGHQNPHLSVAFSQRVLGAAPFADIDERHDDAVDFVLDCAIGPEPREIPVAFRAADLALGRG